MERAVRPIPAGKKRKLQMREELLAHVTGIYLEELPRQSDEAGALAAASARFGSPAEISAELARDVTWNQRLDYRLEQADLLLGRWLNIRGQASLLRYGLGSLAFTATLGAFVFCTYVVLMWATRQTYDPLLLPLTLKLVGHSAVSVFCYLFAIRTIYQACFAAARRPRWPVAAATIAAWIVVFTGLHFAIWYLLTEDIADCVLRMPRFLLNTLLFVMPAILGTIWCVHCVEQRNKPYEPWTKLELDV